jgi:hypothetical protein
MVLGFTAAVAQCGPVGGRRSILRRGYDAVYELALGQSATSTD